MSLPHTNLEAIPFTPLTAEFIDNMNDNIESLSNGSGLEDRSIHPDKIGIIELSGSNITSIDSGVSSTTLRHFYIEGNTAHLACMINYTGSITDTQSNLLQLHPPTGYSFAGAVAAFVGWSDGANGVLMMRVNQSQIQTTDIVHKTGGSSLTNPVIEFSVSFPVQKI